MRYRPEDFFGLSEEQGAKMKEMGRTRAEFDHHLKWMAYGHCCQAVVHLTLALEWLWTHAPRTAARVAKICDALNAAFLKPVRKKGQHHDHEAEPVLLATVEPGAEGEA